MPWSGGGLLFCLAFLVWANSYVTIRVAWLASVGDRAICPRPLLRAIPSVSRAWVVGLKIAPSPARAYRGSQGVEHVYDPGGLGEP